MSKSDLNVPPHFPTFLPLNLPCGWHLTTNILFFCPQPIPDLPCFKFREIYRIFYSFTVAWIRTPISVQNSRFFLNVWPKCITSKCNTLYEAPYQVSRQFSSFLHVKLSFLLQIPYKQWQSLSTMFFLWQWHVHFAHRTQKF